MAELVEMAVAAMAAPHGYHFVADYDSMRLAVVVGDRVIIEPGGVKLPRWS